jgi:hypothetical protein
MAPFVVSSDGNGMIGFGCETKPVKDWLDIVNGNADWPEAAPARDTKEGRMLIAALKAQIAYDEEMNKE